MELLKDGLNLDWNISLLTFTEESGKGSAQEFHSADGKCPKTCSLSSSNINLLLRVAMSNFLLTLRTLKTLEIHGNTG